VLSEAIVAILLPTRHTLIKVRLASIAPVHGVKKRLRKLASLVDIYVLTSDTRGTAKIELQRIPLYRIIVEARKHDVEKRNYLRKSLEPKHVAVFGNGRNDKLWLREVSKAHQWN